MSRHARGRRAITLRRRRGSTVVVVAVLLLTRGAVFATAHGVALLLLLASASVNHGLHVRAVLDVLPKVANVAPYFPVGLERKRDDGDEAEGKPFPSLHYASRVVTAVLTLYCDVFGAGDAGCEGVRSAGEEEEHGEDVMLLLLIMCVFVWRLSLLLSVLPPNVTESFISGKRVLLSFARGGGCDWYPKQGGWL